jgi:hypothetical protein
LKIMIISLKERKKSLLHLHLKRHNVEGKDLRARKHQSEKIKNKKPKVSISDLQSF